MNIDEKTHILTRTHTHSSSFSFCRLINYHSEKVAVNSRGVMMGFLDKLMSILVYIYASFGGFTASDMCLAEGDLLSTTFRGITCTNPEPR